MKRTRLIGLGISALIALMPLGATGVAGPDQGKSAQESHRRLNPLVGRLESMDWYSKDEPLQMRFTLTNPNSVSIWALRWQLPSEDMDANLLQITRDGNPVKYLGPLIKRANPDSEDYLEIKPGETYTVVFDPSAVYEMGAQGRYALEFRVRKLALRTAAPEVKNVIEDSPMFLRRDPQESPKHLDTLPTHRADVDMAAGATLWYEGIPQQDLMLQNGVESVIGGYTKCTTAQQNHLQTASQNATTISGKAVSHLNANPSGSSLFTYWFGAYTSSRFNTVGSHFDALSNAFQTKTITFDCACKKSAYAYVYPTQPYKIYLCRAFWSAPALGRDSKAGTLVHEMSHFNVVAGTDDYVYGATGAHNLALTDPNKAIDNADNHEYFAEDQP